MNIEKYSERVRGFLQSAQTKALADGNPQFTPEHVLKVLLDDEQGMATSLIERAGGNARDARIANDAALAKLPKVSGGNGQVYLAQPLAKVFSTAEKVLSAMMKVFSAPKKTFHGVKKVFFTKKKATSGTRKVAAELAKIANGAIEGTDVTIKTAHRSMKAMDKAKKTAAHAAESAHDARIATNDRTHTTGWPERASRIQLTCQLPRSQDAAPSVSQRLPRPNGSSQVDAQVRMCGMS